MMEPKPEWLTVLPPTAVDDEGENYRRLKGLFSELKLHTVCEEAHCPNVAECWGSGTATLMLMGDVCSRACRFCMVTPGRPAGSPPDPLEPENVALTLSKMGLSYVVLTSVDRDDLPDGGAGHFARTIRATKEMNPGILVEVLIPDFQNDVDSIKTVVEARPDVIAHNIETTLFLSDRVRDPRAGYWQSLSVLRSIKKLDDVDVHKVVDHARAGREGGGGQARDDAPEGRGSRLSDRRAIPAAVREAPALSRSTSGPRSSSTTSGSASRSTVSSTSRRGRWSDPATGPGSSSSARS